MTANSKETHSAQETQAVMYGVLELSFKEGKYGRFPLGTLRSSLGLFILINKELEQFEPGHYEVKGMDPVTFFKTGEYGASIWITRRIKFKELICRRIENPDALAGLSAAQKTGTGSPALPEEMDPVEEERQETPKKKTPASKEAQGSTSNQSTSDAILRVAQRSKKEVRKNASHKPKHLEMAVEKEIAPLIALGFTRDDALLTLRVFTMEERADLLDKDSIIRLDSSVDRTELRVKAELLKRYHYAYNAQLGYWAKKAA